MTPLHWLGLIVLAVIAGAAVPFQSAINANLGRDLGHPLWATLASLLRGDRITVKRSQHRVRFLHPRGWTYFDTLREKLHWNEGH